MDELVALEAIYGDALVVEPQAEPTDPVRGTLVVVVAPATPVVLVQDTQPRQRFAPRIVRLAAPASATTAAADQVSGTALAPQPAELEPEPLPAKTVQVEHLPSFVLNFELPPGYPAEQAPVVLLECSWLSAAQLRALEQWLLALWDAERDAMLYRFADALATDTAATLAECGILADADAPLSLAEDLPDRAALVSAIMEHDARERKLIFQRDRFDCGVCFESKRGTHCFQFPACRHVYCLGCLVDYFTLAITEGSVELVGCPDPSCKKESTKAPKGTMHVPPEHLTAILKAARRSEARAAAKDAAGGDSTDEDDSEGTHQDDADLVERYIFLSENKALEGRPDVAYCPSKYCQTPTPRESIESKLCVCRKCRYPFCYFCRRTWHGNSVGCPLDTSIKEIVEEWKSTETTDERRKQMMLQYGERRINSAIMDVLALEWTQKFCSKCPKCKLPAEKSSGCNHVVCAFCSQHFCYLCGEALGNDNPYAHFNDRSSPCFAKLFEERGHSEDPDLDHNAIAFVQDEETEWRALRAQQEAEIQEQQRRREEQERAERAAARRDAARAQRARAAETQLAEQTRSSRREERARVR
ncbi:hypothetical protein HK105_207991 [Polyrhizophydium stewartii]|uniref:RBR-type E3 ubiquitin transferase n=1 Tax=Polyrhizophydium stewartii TaxID=2732419 RepID=A0ABR4MYZ2_9FUNG